MKIIDINFEDFNNPESELLKSVDVRIRNNLGYLEIDGESHPINKIVDGCLLSKVSETEHLWNELYVESLSVMSAKYVAPCFEAYSYMSALHPSYTRLKGKLWLSLLDHSELIITKRMLGQWLLSLRLRRMTRPPYATALYLFLVFGTNKHWVFERCEGFTAIKVTYQDLTLIIPADCDMVVFNGTPMSMEQLFSTAEFVHVLPTFTSEPVTMASLANGLMLKNDISILPPEQQKQLETYKG